MTPNIEPHGLDGLPHGLYVLLHELRRNLPPGCDGALSVTAVTKDPATLDALERVNGGLRGRDVLTWYGDGFSFGVVYLRSLTGAAPDEEDDAAPDEDDAAVADTAPPFNLTRAYWGAK